MHHIILWGMFYLLFLFFTKVLWSVTCTFCFASTRCCAFWQLRIRRRRWHWCCVRRCRYLWLITIQLLILLSMSSCFATTFCDMCVFTICFITVTLTFTFILLKLKRILNAIIVHSMLSWILFIYLIVCITFASCSLWWINIIIIILIVRHLFLLNYVAWGVRRWKRCL